MYGSYGYTGKLIVHVSPEVKPGDDELTVFWRAVKESADAYAELCERLARGEVVGQVQAGKGRLYQVKDRKLSHERELALRLASGMLDDIDLPKRVTWFGSASQHSPVSRELTKIA